MVEYSHSRSSTAGSFQGDHDPRHDEEKVREKLDGDRATDTTPARKRKSTFADQSQDDPFGDEAEGEVKYKTLHWWYAAHCHSLVTMKRPQMPTF